MDSIIEDIDVLTKYSVWRLFPEYKQTNIARDGSIQEKEKLQSWIDLNKAHGFNLKVEIQSAEDPSTVDISENWPDPDKFLRDFQPNERASESMLEELEATKEKLDNRDASTGPASDFQFKIPFLQGERLVEEDLPTADRRLFSEYERLELSRPLPAKEDARWRTLQQNLFAFKG